MAFIAEAERVAYLIYGHSEGEHAPCFVHFLIQDILMKGNAGFFFERPGEIVPGNMKALGDGLDLQAAVKIDMNEVHASVDERTVTLGNGVFLYRRDKLDCFFAQIINAFLHRPEGVDLLYVPVAQPVGFTFIQTAQNGIVDRHGNGGNRPVMDFP